MVWCGTIFICFYLLSSQITGETYVNADKESLDGLPPYTHEQNKQTFTKDQATFAEDNLQKKRVEGSTQENYIERNYISPIAQYLIKRMLNGKQPLELPPKSTRDKETSREVRADQVIGINSRDNTFPWDEECSGGYKHCGGYFPLCCDGFICLKPLTPWDVRNGFKRCWPHYFQGDEE